MIPMVMLARQIPETLVEERSILMALAEAIGNCANGQSGKKRGFWETAPIYRVNFQTIVTFLALTVAFDSKIRHAPEFCARKMHLNRS